MGDSLGVIGMLGDEQSVLGAFVCQLPNTTDAP